MTIHLHPGDCWVADPHDDSLHPDLVLPEGFTLKGANPQNMTLRLFDTWTWSLWHAQRVLLGDGEHLFWLDREALGVVLMRLDGQAPPALASQMEGWPLEAEIGPLIDLRALMDGLNIEVRQRRWLLADAQGTGVAWALEHTWGEQVRTVQFFAMSGHNQRVDELLATLPQEQHRDQPPVAVALETFAKPRKWTTRPHTDMTHDDPAGPTIKRMMAATLALARLTEDGLCKDIDIKFLHHYRVLIRKTRSVLSLSKGVFEPEDTAELKIELRALAHRTNLMRDCDVHLLGRAEQEARVPERLRDGLGPLFEDLKATRDAEQRAIAAELRDPAYHQRIEAIAALIDGARLGPKADRPMGKLAAKLLTKALRQVLDAGRLINELTPDDDVHDLRLKCKKLRYLLELFRELYPRKALKPLIKSLKLLQDVLGTFNDRFVQQEALYTWLEGRQTLPTKVGVAVGVLLAQLAAEQLQARSQVQDAFALFDQPGLMDDLMAVTVLRREEPALA